MPAKVQEEALRELGRLGRLPAAAPDHTLVRTDRSTSSKSPRPRDTSCVSIARVSVT